MEIILLRTMRVLIVTGFFFGASLYAQPQSEKLTLGILQFDYIEGVDIDPQDVATVQDIVTNAFINSKRFNILEREMLDKLMGEAETQKEENFINNITSLAEQGKMVGAKYLLLGKVSKISIEETNVKNKVEKQDKYDKKTGSQSTSVASKTSDFIAYVNITLRIVDVETGEVTGSTTINIQPGFVDRKLFAANTKGGALRKTEKPITKETDMFLKQNLPIQIQIGKIIEEKKGKVLSLYVLAGDQQGISAGTKINIVRVEFEDFGDGSKTRVETTVSEGKVVELKGAKVSVAKISKGGDQLMKEINGGSDLFCKTIN